MTPRKEHERKIEMSEIEVGMTASAGVVLTVLAHWNNGRVDDAIALFAEEFRVQ